MEIRNKLSKVRQMLPNWRICYCPKCCYDYTKLVLRTHKIGSKVSTSFSTNSAFQTTLHTRQAASKSVLHLPPYIGLLTYFTFRGVTSSPAVDDESLQCTVNVVWTNYSRKLHIFYNILQHSTRRSIHWKATNIQYHCFCGKQNQHLVP